MKRRNILILLILLAFSSIVFGTGYFLFGDQIKAVNSIACLNDRLFYLEYNGDYGLDAFLKQGGAAGDAELTAFLTRFFTKNLYKYEAPEQLIGCSTIAVQLTDGGYGFGRNFDLDDCAALIVRTNPKSGYASISTTNLQFLGFPLDLMRPGLMDKLIMLGATFVPLDGINEQGFCGAILAIAHGGQTNQDTGKPGLTTTAALRLLLDRAATVEEALDLLEQYDMHASADMDYHFAFADATGRSVVVEYVENELHVLELPLATNHFLMPGPFYGIGRAEGDLRYDRLVEYLAMGDGVLSLEQLGDALRSVSQNQQVRTQWSIIYEQNVPRLTFYHLQDFANPLRFDFASGGN